MTIVIKNLPQITHESPRLGEALKGVQEFTNENVTTKPGNVRKPPHLAGLPSVNPTKPAGG